MSTYTVNPNMDLQNFFDQLTDEPHEVLFESGLYEQKLKIRNNHLILKGLGDVTIAYDDYAYKMHDDGLLYNTFRTATLTIIGQFNQLINLKIENRSIKNHLRTGQAIALTIYGDNTTIDHCTLTGHQDTLFIGPLPKDLAQRYAHILPLDERQTKPILVKFNQCKILGDIDFIFGSGNALFNQCDIKVTDYGYVTAPSTYEGEMGFVFYQCIIENLNDDNDVYLGRPWREFGATTFIDCDIKGRIVDPRFDDWQKSNYDFYESPYVSSPFSKKLKDSALKEILELFKN